MRLVLVQPDIPQNVGAAIRTAACFGADVDIVEPCGFALTDKALRRAAMDYAERARITRHASWAAFCASRAPADGLSDDVGDGFRSGRLILLTTKAADSLWTIALRPDDAIVCGRESAGAPPEVHAAADVRARIPLAAGARSLNVVVAAGVALAEAARQAALRSDAGGRA